MALCYLRFAVTAPKDAAAHVTERLIALWIEHVDYTHTFMVAAFRKLPEADRSNMTPNKALMMMLEQPTLVKRPVFDLGGRYVVGFKEPEKQSILAAKS